MAGRIVIPWQYKDGRLVAAGHPPRGGATQARAKTVQVSVSPILVPGPAPVPYPTYTDHPIVRFEDLDTSYRSRNLNKWSELPDMNVILNKLTALSYVTLPDGFRGKLVDFKSLGSPYSVYAPKCAGVWGNGPEKAVIRLQPMSSTMASTVPLQGVAVGNGNGDGVSNPLTMWRLGPQGGRVSGAVHEYGFAMFGTHQPDQPAGPKTPAHPHNYSGHQHYYGQGSTLEYAVIGGVQGDWQSPPGETFQSADYKGQNNIRRFVEFTGFTEGDVAHGAPPTDYVGTSTLEEERVGGGVGNNGSLNPTYIDCNFHDFFISGGPIVSGAGGPGSSLCIGGTMIRNKSWYNANHFPQNTPGKQFGALNNEGCIGPQQLFYDQPDVRLGPYQAVLQNYHFFAGNWLQDHPDIVINKPIWQGRNSPTGTWIPATNGAFIVGMPINYSGTPNSQVTPPKVIHPNGNVLQPVFRKPNTGWPQGVNPETQYIIVQ